MKEQVKKFFEVTNNYLHKDFGVQLRKEILQRELGEIKGRKFLDIGCGNGSISLPYVRQNELTLLDFSENMLLLAKKSIPDDRANFVKVINMDFFDLPRHEKYDIIFFIGVLAHIQRPVHESFAFLEELLSDQGKIYLQYSDFNHWLTKSQFFFRNSQYKINQITSKMVEEDALKCGLGIEKCIRYAGTMPGMGKLSNQALLNYVRFVTNSKLLNFLKAERILVLSKQVRFSA